MSETDLAQMFTFTLVRNPWDRMVSYYHWLRAQHFDHPVVQLAQAETFEGFLRDRGTQVAQHKWPSSQYMTDAQGVERCSLYIRLEHFAEDAKPLIQHLGFDVSLPTQNASARARDFREYYSDETRDIIAACCAEDIARFGYAFE